MTFPMITSDADLLKNHGWHDFVAGHPEGSVFQSPWMHDLFSATKNFEPVVIGQVDDVLQISGILLAVIIREMAGPLGYFSARCVVYGGPIVSAGSRRSATDSQISNDLIASLVSNVRQRCVFIQFRNFRDMSGLSREFESLGFRYRERLNSVIDTRSESQVLQRISPSRLRQVRQGLARGAEITEASTLEEVREFYSILRKLYREKVKKPLPGWTFFEAFFQHSLNDHHGNIFLVRFKGKVIGGILCPYMAGRSIYEWYVCGLDQEYKELHPSVLATWAGIRFAARNGLTRFDFMGVGVPGKPYGVRDFKARFGGETVNFGRYARINNRLLYFISEIGYNFLGILKKI